MAEFALPYGREHLTLRVEDERLAGVLTSRLEGYRPALGGEALVREALEHPIGSPRLCELAAGKRNVVVITSDHTRPVPSHITMPLILEEIRRGNPEAGITILIAVGLHRATTEKELRGKLGDAICDREHIVIHDCDDESQLVSLGRLPSGGELVINRLAAEADLLVADGFIEPHFFAGFSGGRKSVLPGVASRSTVMYNHNSGFIAHPRARTGVLEGNPVHIDMEFAARAAKLAFIVNTIVNAAHEPVYAVAGACEAAHRAGCAFLASRCQVDAAPADIVVTTNGGYPLDQNVYQSVKGMTAAEASVKPGGVIVMAARCEDGHGGKSFYETFRDESDLARMTRTFLERGPEETIVDQWQSQIFARVLTKARVVFVSDCDERVVRDLHMLPARDLDDAMAKARALVGRDDWTVTVIPDGVAVMVREV